MHVFSLFSLKIFNYYQFKYKYPRILVISLSLKNKWSFFLLQFHVRIFLQKTNLKKTKDYY